MATFVLVNGEVKAVLNKREQKQVAALLVPQAVETAPTFDPHGGIRCAVDPACTWTGKSAKRAAVHATPATLQAEGHLPKV